MKHTLFLATIINKDKNYEGCILARTGKALVRGIFSGACFNEKENIR